MSTIGFFFPEETELNTVSVEMGGRTVPRVGEMVWFSVWEPHPDRPGYEYEAKGRKWEVAEVHWSLRIWVNEPREANYRVEVHLIPAPTEKQKEVSE